MLFNNRAILFKWQQLKLLLSVSAHAFHGHGFSLLVAKSTLLWGLQLELVPQESAPTLQATASTIYKASIHQTCHDIELLDTCGSRVMPQTFVNSSVDLSTGIFCGVYDITSKSPATSE